MSTRTSPRQLRYHMQRHTVTHMACCRHHLPHSGATTRESEYPVLQKKRLCVRCQSCPPYLAERHKDMLTQSQYPAKDASTVLTSIHTHVSQHRDTRTLYPYTKNLQRSSSLHLLSAREPFHAKMQILKPWTRNTTSADVPFSRARSCCACHALLGVNIVLSGSIVTAKMRLELG
jgi:hypothetical protein